MKKPEKPSGPHIYNVVIANARNLCENLNEEIKRGKRL